jgi:hypothetical protein
MSSLNWRRGFRKQVNGLREQISLKNHLCERGMEKSKILYARKEEAFAL